MKLKIFLFTLLAAMAPALSHAISMGSISDAVSNNTSISSTAHPTTPQPIKNSSSKNTPAAESHLPNPALFIEDSAMTAYIHSQLLLKSNIPHVDVTTENAVVSLSGTVDTKEQANTLIKIASSVKGVKSVNTDHLMVREKTNPDMKYSG